jgi:hypothetical protein
VSWCQVLDGAGCAALLGHVRVDGDEIAIGQGLAHQVDHHAEEVTCPRGAVPCSAFSVRPCIEAPDVHLPTAPFGVEAPDPKVWLLIHQRV